jgi:hypothetical protein
MLRKLLDQIISQNKVQARADAYRDLIRKEAVIGGTLFGAVPKGHRRDFFCLDEHTWVWHEEWVNRVGERHVRTTRYDVRPSGVVKMQDGKTYQLISPTEAKNLLEAVRLYHRRVMSELYSQPV